MGLVLTEITLKNVADEVRAKDVLLGNISLFALDLTIDPLKEEVIGAHGDEEVHYIYGSRNN